MHEKGVERAWIRFLALLVSLLAVLACGVTPPETPLAVPTSPVKASATRATSTTPYVEVTRLPTSSPEAREAAETPDPDLPLGIGPWLLMEVDDALWAMNPDGSGLIQLIGHEAIINLDMDTAVGPYNHQLAYITAEDPVRMTGLTLRILDVHLLEFTIVSPLTSPQTEPGPEDQPGDLIFQNLIAISSPDCCAWSPDGKKLAFVAMTQGPTSDLYVYDLELHEVLRLTDGPSQAMRPVWSPDGGEIVHIGVHSLGTGAGYDMAGIWSAAADGSGVAELYAIEAGSGDEVVVSWIWPREFMVYTWDAFCGKRSLRSYDLESGEITPYWSHYFSEIATTEMGAPMLLSVNRGIEGCNEPGWTGTWRVIKELDGVSPITEVGFDEMEWLVRLGRFIGRIDREVYQVSELGEVERRQDAPANTLPRLSGSGEMLAYAATSQRGQAGVWVAPVDGDPVQISTEEAFAATWVPGEDQLIFFSESGAYLARPPDFEPVLISNRLDVGPGDFAWVWP